VVVGILIFFGETDIDDLVIVVVDNFDSFWRFDILEELWLVEITGDTFEGSECK